MGAGAGVASLFLAPVVAGSGAIYASTVGGGIITSLSTANLIGIGVITAATTGFAGGFVSNLYENLRYNSKTVPDTIFSAVVNGTIYSALNVTAGFLGALSGPGISLSGIVYSAILAGPNSALGVSIELIIEVLRVYF